MTKRLALLGGAESTRGGVWDSQADEVWTLNWFYSYSWVPRVDRLFEMHPIWLYADTDREEWQKPKDHWWELHNPKPFPIYMLTKFKQIPSGISYPIDEVTEYIFGDRLLYGDKASDFYSSSFDYMMALAIYEKWDIIELYGFEMGSLTEYRYQREGAAYFIGQANGRGIQVIRPRNSVLLRSRRYGYSGDQMIFRQDLERLHDKWTEINRDALARLQFWEGRASGNGDTEVLENQRAAREEALIASGGLQLLEYQIKFIDLEEPEVGIKNPLKSIPINGSKAKKE